MAKGTMKLNRIRIPDQYIRSGGHDERHAETLYLAVLDATDNQKPSEVTTELFARVVGSLIIRKTTPKRGRDYEVVEGVHRYLVATKLKLEDVPVEIRSYDSEGDAHLDQLVENVKTKLGLKRSDRDKWIRMLCTPAEKGGDGLKQAVVAKATGMSEGSISRIVGGTQSGEGRTLREKPKRKRGKKGKGKKDGAVAENGFDVAGWYAGLSEVTALYKDHADEIAAQKEGQSEVIADAYNALYALVGA